MASPKRRPANLKIVEGRGPDRDGNDRDSGGRVIKPPPGFTRLPPAKPEEMSTVAAEMWDRTLPELQRLELTKPIDGPALEMLCECYARWHAARAMRLAGSSLQAVDVDGVPVVVPASVNGLLGQNSQGWVTAPWIGIERASKEYRAWCSEFGLTPAAETKVGAGGTDDGADDNPFAGGPPP